KLCTRNFVAEIISEVFSADRSKQERASLESANLYFCSNLEQLTTTATTLTTTRSITTRIIIIITIITKPATTRLAENLLWSQKMCKNTVDCPFDRRLWREQS